MYSCVRGHRQALSETRTQVHQDDSPLKRMPNLGIISVNDVDELD